MINLNIDYDIPLNISTPARFPASHIVPDHPPCNRLHGHTWEIIIEVNGLIKKDGMVVDFKLLKNMITDKFDHRTLIPDLNIATGIEVIRNDENYLEISVSGKEYKFPKSDIYILNDVPVVTSEYIALYLKREFEKLYPDKFTITVYEGKNSYAKV